MQPDLDLSWANENPGKCSRCGEPHEHVRPGKTQPTCECDEHCWIHGDGVRLEYRGEDHPVNVASRTIGYGMGLGYHCPACEAEHDEQILAMANK
jgi:hypothetical protein